MGSCPFWLTYVGHWIFQIQTVKHQCNLLGYSQLPAKWSRYFTYLNFCTTRNRFLSPICEISSLWWGSLWFLRNLEWGGKVSAENSLLTLSSANNDWTFIYLNSLSRLMMNKELALALLGRLRGNAWGAGKTIQINENLHVNPLSARYLLFVNNGRPIYIKSNVIFISNYEILQGAKKSSLCVALNYVWK